MPLSDETIIWGFRLFLDRDPESEAVIAAHRDACKTVADLRTILLSSSEFNRKGLVDFVPTFPGHWAPLEIETKLTPEMLEKLFQRVENSWEQIGDEDPHWSVMANDRFDKANMAQAREEFYATGQTDANLLRHTLRRNGLEIGAFRSCVEIGCGVGRITCRLAELFDSVNAFDISRSHLALAQERVDELGLKNVTLRKFESIKAIVNLPKVDVVFSIIVLQHNPPPVIAFMIEQMLACLNPGGVALFQVPTYIENYSFKAASYLKSKLRAGELEMHAIHQSTVFDIAEKMDCRLLEVIDDDCIGRQPGSISNTFLFRKR